VWEKILEAGDKSRENKRGGVTATLEMGCDLVFQDMF
jgi:hypothetical protein